MTDILKQVVNNELAKLEQEKQNQREATLAKSNYLLPSLLSEIQQHGEVNFFRI